MSANSGLLNRVAESTTVGDGLATFVHGISNLLKRAEKQPGLLPGEIASLRKWLTKSTSAISDAVLANTMEKTADVASELQAVVEATAHAKPSTRARRTVAAAAPTETMNASDPGVTMIKGGMIKGRMIKGSKTDSTSVSTQPGTTTVTQGELNANSMNVSTPKPIRGQAKKNTRTATGKAAKATPAAKPKAARKPKAQQQAITEQTQGMAPTKQLRRKPAERASVRKAA